ncbi:enoyl-CoA hydratase [Sphingomonas sp. Root710]|uniref:enoyl-CoA hydratase/isomerase family protein n=1 Tax=Sphingomonas sp. Root710 TaxID=1736594 RepID=UPI0006F967C1|nr:enoyl-CoA hydratase/isomerase family protein [Sphingomonas sp. Root710]KRB82389.1 enoyl-CoA hydratase [Sphingomonas sp. Root710]
MSAGLPADEVLASVEGRLGVITLNRPKALNALNLAMVEQLDAILTAWESDPAIDAVLVRSASERAFCAGGDVRSIGILPDPADRMALGRAFFGTEYRVNRRINGFPKPYVALINGVAMGGGLGLSIHGSHRVVSENLRMAMPETVLGLFPDVGGTWFLNRCPGMIGRYLALIGPQIGAADALTAGLATHHVLYATFDALAADLATAGRLDHGAVDAIIAAHATPAEGGTLGGRRADIDRLFSVCDLEGVAAAIDAAAAEADWIAEAQAVLGRASPTSLHATWRRMVEGKDQPIERILSDDFRMGVRMVGGHDFAEGVRAILVDKDQSPRWDPPTLADVTTTEIDALLAPFDDGAEWAA